MEAMATMIGGDNGNNRGEDGDDDDGLGPRRWRQMEDNIG